MKNYLKRISVIILSINLIMTFSCFALENNLQEHWAYEAINQLLNEKIISGDQEGNIRPQDFITRAEFVKILNKTFSFTEIGTETFSDVSSTQWYYNDFLIARKAGYVAGDSFGKASPNANITRAEACVMIGRILGQEEGNQDISFSDSNEIPAWAFGAVKTLTKKGFVSGYPDGSFQSNNSVTRAEAFYMIFKISNQKNEQKNTPDQGSETNIGGMPSTVNSRNSNGKGSNGGGASGQTPKLPIPLISRYHEDSSTLVWKGVKNASSYEIIIKSGKIEEIVTVPAKTDQIEYSEDLTKTLNIISGNFDDAKIPYEIRMKALGKSGYIDSLYTDSMNFYRIYDALATPVLTSRFGKANQVERGIVSWDEVTGAKEYEVKFFIGTEESKDFKYDNVNREILIEDLSILKNNSAYVLVKAISENKQKYKNSLVEKLELVKPAEENRGTGTQQDPIRIYTKAHFNEIRSGIDKHYMLMNNLDLSDYISIPEFKGSLTTFNNQHMAIKLNINATSSYTGLFGKLNGGKVSNLVIKGSVKGTSYTGSVAGYCPGGATIENCINMAVISGTESVGGIVGNSVNSNAITQCYNFGSVTGSSKNVGGICGFINGTNVDLCGNYGEISGGSNTGGIAGAAYGSIYNSYNVGTIKKGNAGIAGIIQKPEIIIKNCYNLGSVTGTGSGIVDQFSTGGTVEDCYNAGTASNPIVRKYLDNNNVVVIEVLNSLYVSDTLASDNLSGTEAIKSADLEKKDHPLVMALLDKNFEFAEGNLYPSIKNNHQFNEQNILIYEEVSDLNYALEGTTLTFSWEVPQREDIEQILIQIQNNSAIQTIVEETELSKDQNTFVLSDAKLGCFYEIQVRIKYKNGTYSGVMNLEVLAQTE